MLRYVITTNGVAQANQCCRCCWNAGNDCVAKLTN